MLTCAFYRNVFTVCIFTAMFHGTAVASEEGADEPTTRTEIYGQGVRETPKLTPEQERVGFHLPTGFKIQLVAAEPQIAKPMNMAFDARGRLWVTSTLEYPYPANGPGRDSIIILEDENGDGAADKFRTFADGLNIPIGILPVHDGAICFSIPHIWYLRDTDGDDSCDERIKLLGPFDTTRDTHGMINAMRRGWDGWIYACHGYNNQSNVTAKDGSNIRLTSGNTLRFRDDGSRIEQFTQGQVNPFGMTRDQWGNWFTADCHSKPITFLLHRGCFPSFGRPHDGSGFVPDMMSHAHGSTAICGIVYYNDSHFPAKFRERFYSGNVMTSRINANRPEWNGASVQAIELPDFLTSDDPWFRPVDLQLGPDGALYVADFYNKIIGHYEVPLTHPERDRESGRIWRITWQGDQRDTPTVSPHRNLLALSSTSDLQLDSQFYANLASDHPTVRDLTLDRLLARPLAQHQIAALRDRLLSKQSAVNLRVGVLWALHRAKALDETSRLLILQSELPLLQAAALRSIADNSQSVSSIPTQNLATVRNLLHSEHPQVRLAAVAAITAIGDPTDVRRLLSISSPATADPVFKHAAKLAARELLKVDASLDWVLSDWRTGMKSGDSSNPTTWTPDHKILIADPLAVDVARILQAIPSQRAAEASIAFLSRHSSFQTELLDGAIEHATRNLPVTELSSLLDLIRTANSEDIVRQSELTERLGMSLKARGLEFPSDFRNHLQRLASRHASELVARTQANMPSVDWREARGRAWQMEPRRCDDGQSASMYSSFTLGEDYVGSWATEPFLAPRKLSFWIAGHNGRPGTDGPNRNLVRLLDAIDRTVLMTAAVPRNDIARRIDWDLADVENRQVILECVDGDQRRAFAWIAIGRFSDGRLDGSHTTRLADSLARLLKISPGSEAVKQAESLVTNSQLSRGSKLRLLSAAWESDGRQTQAVLVSLAEKYRPQAADLDKLVRAMNDVDLKDFATQVVQALTVEQQRLFARSVLGEAQGRQLLNLLVRQGTMSISALRGARDLLPTRVNDASVSALMELSLQADQVMDERPGILLQRLEKLDLATADAESGRAVFEKHCANCHQLDGRGQTIGPQLDGIGARGTARLAEDILLPNRNVDIAFRITAILFDDDKVLSGLLREQPDGSLILVGNDGKSTPISATNIVERRNTQRSLMPENMSELLSDQDFAALLAYLSRSAEKKVVPGAPRKQQGPSNE